MLNRRLIMDHPYLIAQALSVRYPPYTPHYSEQLEEVFDTIDQVAYLGKQAFDLDKQIKDLRRERNEISDKFPKASKEEKLILKLEVANLKMKISELENLYEIVEKQCQDNEALIPNIPDPGVPLWSGISDHNKDYYQSVLRIVHQMIDEYAGNKVMEDD